jgi:Zn-dependent M16 (insulinase) family peptidase
VVVIYARLVTESGTKRVDDVDMSRLVGANPGGIWTSSYLTRKHIEGGRVSDIDNDALLYFLMHGKAVGDKIDVMFDLMAELLVTARLDNQQKAIDFLKEAKVRKQAAVVTSGHAYAATRIASK